MEVEIKSEWRNWRKAGVYIVLIGVSFLSLWLQMVLAPSLMVFYLYGYKWWLKVRKSSLRVCVFQSGGVESAISRIAAKN